MKLDLAYQLTDAYETYITAESALELATLAKESAKENYRITKERHAYGEVDTLSLIKAQANLTSAQNAYYDAYYDLNIDFSTIERVAGE